MKRKPIMKPSLVGCLNCSSVPECILNKNKKISIYGIVSLKINGQKEKWFNDGYYRGKPLTINRIMKKWGHKIKHEFWTELFIGSPMHGEIYEYDKKTDNWYLVEQTRGIF